MPIRDDVTTAPLWKQAMLVLLALFPAVMIETLYLFPHLTSFNLVLAHFLGVILIVCSITWIFMPITLKILGWWLMPQSTKHHYAGIVIVISLYLIEIGFFQLIS